MSYVLKITQIADGAFVGYVHVPSRNAKRLEFTTLQLKHAQRIAGNDKAHQRAMRYNTMNQERGLQVAVVPFEKEMAHASQEAARN